MGKEVVGGKEVKNNEAPLISNVKRLPEMSSSSAKVTSNHHLCKQRENDIVSAESTDDDELDKFTQDEDLETEVEDEHLDPDQQPSAEDKVRKNTLLSTILMPRPKPKPPFTIEAAMNKLLKKKNEWVLTWCRSRIRLGDLGR